MGYTYIFLLKNAQKIFKLLCNTLVYVNRNQIRKLEVNTTAKILFSVKSVQVRKLTRTDKHERLYIIINSIEF